MVPNAENAGAGEGGDGGTECFSGFLGRSSSRLGISNPIPPL